MGREIDSRQGKLWLLSELTKRIKTIFKNLFPAQRKRRFVPMLDSHARRPGDEGDGDGQVQGRGSRPDPGAAEVTIAARLLFKAGLHRSGGLGAADSARKCSQQPQRLAEVQPHLQPLEQRGRPRIFRKIIFLVIKTAKTHFFRK
jgi:hypothetical protein